MSRNLYGQVAPAAIWVMVLLAAGTAAADTLPLIPWPRSVIESAGAFQLTDHATIDYDDASASSAAGVLQGLHLRRRAEGADITLRVVPSADLGVEGYRLNIDPKGITINAATARGMYYGVQTLLQIVPASCAMPCAVRAVRIEDSPRFEWRGLLVDISRHFFGKPVLMRIIDEMAALKLNVLHLHLTDDAGWRFEVPAYPKLVSIGSRGNEETPGVGPPQYLSRRDVRELVKYANERYIEIVPEIELPTHAGAAARAYPEFFDGERSINAGRQASMKFVEEVFAEAARQFPSRYLHFGGDEFSGASWERLPEVQTLRERNGLHSQREVESFFDGQVAGAIAALGREAMAWDEAAEAGVRPDVLVQWWRKGRPEILDAAVRSGHDVVLSPVDQVYLDYPNALGEPGAPWEGNDNGPTSVGKILRWEPVPQRFTPEEARRVRGVEAALWTEFIRSEKYLQFMLYPRLQAFAEIAWSAQSPHDPVEFEQRLAPHVQRMVAKGIHARRGPQDAVEFQTH